MRGNTMKRNVSIILLSVLSLLLAGCSDSDDHLKPGTEMMLNEAAANSLTVENMINGRSPNRVSKGTKVRVINDPRGPNDLGEVEVYVLEGVNKDEKVSVSRRNLVTF